MRPAQQARLPRSAVQPPGDEHDEQHEEDPLRDVGEEREGEGATDGPALQDGQEADPPARGRSVRGRAGRGADTPGARHACDQDGRERVAGRVGDDDRAQVPGRQQEPAERAADEARDPLVERHQRVGRHQLIAADERGQ